MTFTSLAKIYSFQQYKGSLVPRPIPSFSMFHVSGDEADTNIDEISVQQKFQLYSTSYTLYTGLTQTKTAHAAQP